MNDLLRYTLGCRETDIARLEKDLACAEADGENLRWAYDACNEALRSECERNAGDTPYWAAIAFD
ncbi:MAG: hypothetical protein IAE94_01840 [Chthoniobacterales bacterium]|nr:hypothetical protein [Chthoniobacterales bacterium]